MKRAVLYSCLFCLFFAMIFHQFLFIQLTQWSLKAYSVSKWGQPLEYESFFWSNRGLEIIRPHLNQQTFFKADHMTLNFHLHWWQRHLNVDVDLENPHWDLQTTAPSTHWKNWEKELIQDQKWIKMTPAFHIHAGTLAWNVENAVHQFYFDLDGNSWQGGEIKLYFDPNDKLDHYLQLQALSTNQGMEVNCRCEKVHCSSMMASLQYLNSDFARSYSITSGQLEGQFKAIFSDKKRPYLQGELTIDQLAFHHSESHLNGFIGKAFLKLEKNQSVEGFNEQFPTIFGQLDISDSTSLSYSDSQKGWKIKGIEGRIELDPLQIVTIDLHARVGSSLHDSNWLLQGKANLNANESSNLDLILNCSSSKQDVGEIHLSLSQFKQNHKHLKMELKEFDHAECDILQTLLSTHWPIFSEIELEKGTLNACIEMDMTPQGIQDLDIKKFQAFQLSSKFKPWSMQCHFDKVVGHGKANLGKSDFWPSLQAGIQLENGTIRFEEISPKLPLTNIQASLLIRDGHLDHSLVTLQVAGLKGNMDVEWGDHKELLIFKLEGKGEDLLEFFPSVLREGLHQNFYHDRVIVLANLKRQNRQIEFGGTFHIQEADKNRQNLIHFGCELKEFTDHVSQQYVPIGWFYAQHLPLDKYLSPFIFRHGLLSMSGEAELKGSFDDHYLTIKYDIDNLKIENHDLSIEVPHLHSIVPGQLAGTHRIDLKTYSHQGALPIQQGTYFEKNSGLYFHGIQGLVIIKNQLIQIEPIEAYCQGIYFGGDLSLEYSDPSPSVFSLKIDCPTVSGKISQIQNLLSHLSQVTLMHKIPLEGEVTCEGDGLKLQFDFVPKDYHLQAGFCGSITNGSLPFEDSDIALKGIDMEVNYSHEKQLLEFSDIQGALLVGKPKRVEEYLLTGDYLRFRQMADPLLELDIAVHDHSYELLRLVGYTEAKDQMKSFYLNPNLSHLSCLYPQFWQLDIKEGSQIDKFEFRSQFDLNHFLQDIQRFQHTGLPFISPNFIHKISHYLPLEGRGVVTFRHHPHQGITYQLEASNVKHKDSQEHFGFLKCFQQGTKWVIDQLQWDDWNAYAEIEKKGDRLKIPFLGLNAGQGILLGFEGDLQPEEGLLRAKLKFCDVNLEEFEKREFFRSIFFKWLPKGHLKILGDFEWNCFPDFWEGLKATLLVETHQLSLRNYPLRILNPFSLEIRPGRIFCLQDVQIELKNQSSIHLQRLEYSSLQDALNVLQLKFHFPAAQLKKIGQTFQQIFPEKHDLTFQNLLVNCKQKGELTGNLAVEENSFGQQCIYLKLDDGNYTFKKAEYDIKNFELKLVKNQLHFSTSTQHERYFFDIVGQTQWPIQTGSFSLIGKEEIQPLLIKWEKDSENGLTITSMQGEFAGCHFDLKENKESAQEDTRETLGGKVSVDFNRLCPFLSLDVAQTIKKLKIGSLFFLDGHFWMNSDLGNHLLEMVFFKGKLTSHEAILKGIQVRELEGEMQYVPGRLDINHFLIRDKAGSLKSPSMTALFDRAQDEWQLYIPHLTVKNLRLALLRDTESAESAVMQRHSKFRSLLIKRIELEDFYGKLDRMEKWRAQGNMHFLNPSRKSFFHPLLAIPGEIILRLGLDPQVLNPVTGTIYFKLLGNRFYLTRFKDVFSEGRGSKFYLAQSPYPSWMDFDGNLFVQVRMKQYNLIFKIAELFTVSVKGNIKKPRYALYKQPKSSHKSTRMPLMN